MERIEFILENSHRKKIKNLIQGIVTLTVIVALSILFTIKWYSITNALPFLRGIVGQIENQAMNTSPLGLFYITFIASIFFIPSPDELIFYYGLVKIGSIWLVLIATMLGYMLAQVLNYYLGLKLSSFILNFVSKKKVYKTRRFINKYGSYGIFLFNLLPFPAPLLTFALGIARYNFKRLFVITFIGKICKYLIVAAVYLWIAT